MKKCTKCGEEKGLGEFNKNKTTKDYLHSWCKKCLAQYYYNHQTQRIKYSREYKQTHQEAVIKYYQTHKQEIIQYYQVHKKANAEKRKQYYQLHREEIVAYKKQYYQAHQGRMIEKKRQYRLTHKKIILGKHYKYRYGLNYEEVSVMLNKQEGRCLICNKDIVLMGHASNSAYVDHDHKTNKIRGLLCHNCNSLLGNAKDSIIILLKAATYLQNSLLTKVVKPGKVIDTNTV